jgi:subtilisin-like proprotein convertase family protein
MTKLINNTNFGFCKTFTYMPRVILFTLFFFQISINYAQVFSGYGGDIKDNGSKNFYKQNVSGLSNAIDTKFGIMGVNINIKHQYDADLTIFVISPNNTVIELSSGNGGSGKNYDDCTFTNNSSSKISKAKAPFTGSYKPEGSLGVINNGQNPNGEWKLLIVDTKMNKDTGILINWSLIFTNTPSKLEPFINSNLPLILINTHGKAILDEPRIWSEMQIINNASKINAVGDSSQYYKYGITIETRGSTSQSFPKKPMGFTTVLKNLADTNVSLLGLPEEHDWILNATYNDKSLMRDVLTYELARRSGRYASRHRYCELFINGNYEGIYVLMEKVKRDKYRVDISKLEPKDSVGNALTGGYILKIDKTTGNNNGGFNANGVYYQYDYPNGSDMVAQQIAYIQNYLGKFETALSGSQFQDPSAGFRQYADVNTFIDYSIMNEISKNVDGYRLSTYLFKERDSRGGKFRMGPIWDFNLAWNNADYNNSSSPIGWEIDLSSGLPFWWKRFRQDTAYVKAYYCRWNQLRQSTLSLYNIYRFIDSTYNQLEEASYRNFQRWPVMGNYIWPNPSPLSYSMREEVDSLKSWILKRCEWIDSELATDCKKVNTCSPKVAVFADKLSICKNQSTKLFADGLGVTFKWSPATGLSKTNGREVIANPSSTTTYKVVMQTKAGCKDSTTITIKVSPLPNKTITGNTSFCEGGSTTLTAASGSKTYQWSPITGLDTAFGKKVIAKPNFNITYKVNFTDSLGCKDSNTILIKVNKNPIVSITANKDTLCLNDSAQLKATGAFTYYWPAATGLKESFKAIVNAKPNNTTYAVIGTSDMGCKDTGYYTLKNYQKAPISIQNSDNQLCYGASTWLTAKNVNNFYWEKTTDFIGSKDPIIQVSPKANTLYTLTGFDIHGCKDTAKIEIEVYPEISFKVSGNKKLCFGETTQLTASGSYDFKWSPSLGLNKTEGSQIIASPKVSTTYTIIAQANLKCSDTGQIDITVHELPVLSYQITNDTIEEGQSTVIKLQGAKSYLWNPNSWLQYFTDSVISSPMETTQYEITGTDSNQCQSSIKLQITVNKKVGLAPINIPTAFKIYPNPFNSYLIVETNELTDIMVYSLQGHEIYRTQLTQKTNKIQLDMLSRGIYLVQLKSLNNHSFYKLIKD